MASILRKWLQMFGGAPASSADFPLVALKWVGMRSSAMSLVCVELRALTLL